MRLLDLIRKKRYLKPLVSDIKQSYCSLKQGRSLSEEQEKEIESYYNHLIGKEVSLDWHKYFYKRTGIFSTKYIPSDLYYSSLIVKLNYYPFHHAYSDKNLTDKILIMVKQPETIIKNSRGYFYSSQCAISVDEALRICWCMDDVIIKPSLAAHGEGVKKFSVKDGKTSINGMTIEELFSMYKENFIIQKVIKQHSDMAALNPSSVNTIRILTYRSGMEVLVLYTVIRIGRIGHEVDNETAGGISAKINQDGTLSKYAFGAPGNDMIERTDTGIVLEGYAIPSFDEAINVVKRAHLSLPYFDLIGWDIAIDVEGEPILIEWNTWPELSQSANGPAFGDYTERVFNEVWSRQNSRCENWG